MNLLIVNDAVLELQTLKRSVPWEDCGIREVYPAYSAKEGKESILSHPIDLLLCDIEMPGENGLSLIKWIRENNYNIDCILLTCHADFAYAKEAVSLDCRDYILMPAKQEEIITVLKRVVQRRKNALEEKQLQEFGKSWVKTHETELAASGAQAKKTSEIAEECSAYILEHLGDEELNVNDIASIFYLNPIYLNRIFKKEKGRSINQWIIAQRMQLAAELLKTSSFPIHSIANKVGYYNYPFFCTTFKKYFGCTPSQYGNRNDQEI